MNNNVVNLDGREIDLDTGEVIGFSAERAKMRALLYSKIRACSGTAIEKKGKNMQQGYDFARESDVTEAVYELTHDAGLALVFEPLPAKFEFVDVQTKNGSVLEARLWLTLNIVDTDTGFEIKLPFLGVGRDSYDKAIYKAYTGAKKYALMMTFGISTGADPESDEKPERAAPAAPAIPRIAIGELRAKFVEKMGADGDWAGWLVENLGIDKDKPKPLTAQQTQDAAKLIAAIVIAPSAPKPAPPAPAVVETPSTSRTMSEVTRGVREAKDREIQWKADDAELSTYAEAKLPIIGERPFTLG